MFPTIYAITCLALLTSAMQVTVNTPNSALQAGQEATLTWSISADGTVPPGTVGSLWLVKVNGDINNLTSVQEIGSNLNPDATQFKWNVPSSISNGKDYALQWKWANESASSTRYSAPFTIQGGSDSQSIAQIPTLPSTSSTTTTTTTATRTSTIISPTPTPSPANSADGRQYQFAVMAGAAVAGLAIIV